MGIRRKLIGACAPMSLAVCFMAISPAKADTTQPQKCHLDTGIQHIVHIQFDNVHF
ncbi:MAG: hypothetical protein JWO04_6202 [Gammaproteobacteria bacterium]|nr:hypothetical protein [Gammaproteobacteria bacterium]